MYGADRKQILALAALTLAFVGVLHDLVPSGEPLRSCSVKCKFSKPGLRKRRVQRRLLRCSVL
jgi:hypothetical protein